MGYSNSKPTHPAAGKHPARAGRAAPAESGSVPAFRSGAVARMTLMPVATLRIWEQRYEAVRPATTASGHRLYRAEDVQRVLLLRQLTHQGHAIGSIAGLETAQLRDLLERQAGIGETAGPEPGRGADRNGVLRMVVVGPALAARLQRAEVARRLKHPVAVVAVFETLAAAVQGASADGVDMLVCHSPSLQAVAPWELEAARSAWGASKAVVLFRFAGASVTKSIADTGAMVFREPQDDESLGVWLSFLQSASPAPSNSAPARATRSRRAAQRPESPRPRRFDDTTLTAIAGHASASMCECPRHVAELLMQISSFEAYSADCTDRHPADAELHAYLRQIAEASRCMFEAALEKVASHEGWTLR